MRLWARRRSSGERATFPRMRRDCSCGRDRRCRCFRWIRLPEWWTSCFPATWSGSTQSPPSARPPSWSRPAIAGGEPLTNDGSSQASEKTRRYFVEPEKNNLWIFSMTLKHPVFTSCRAFLSLFAAWSNLMAFFAPSRHALSILKWCLSSSILLSRVSSSTLLFTLFSLSTSSRVCFNFFNLMRKYSILALESALMVCASNNSFLSLLPWLEEYSAIMLSAPCFTLHSMSSCFWRWRSCCSWGVRDSGSSGAEGPGDRVESAEKVSKLKSLLCKASAC